MTTIEALRAWGDYDRDGPFPLFAAVRELGAVHAVTLADGHEAWRGRLRRGKCSASIRGTTTPAEFAVSWAELQRRLAVEGKDSDSFPNALATVWFHITDAAEADRIFRQRLAPTIDRPQDVLRERLPVGPAAAFAESFAPSATPASDRCSSGRSRMRSVNSSCSASR